MLRKKKQKFEGKNSSDQFIRPSVSHPSQIALDKLLAAPTKEDLKLMMKPEYHQCQELARKEQIFERRQRIKHLLNVRQFRTSRQYD